MVWDGFQRSEHRGEIQMEAFSTQADQLVSIFDVLHDFDSFAFVFGGLILSLGANVFVISAPFSMV